MIILKIFRHFVIPVITGCLFSTALAQTSDTTTNSAAITGKLIDSKTNKPVDFANIALLEKPINKPVRVGQTDLEGKFKLSNLPLGNFSLKISFVGYNPLSIDVTLSETGKTLSLNDIKLTPSSSKVLEEVVIQGKRPSMQLGIDRKVFNVEQSLVSQGGAATDLLANIPSVSVDVDGNVSLRGTNNVRILIDGKPSAIAGSNIAQVLQSIPASAIQNIELITNPSSKYDAEGQSGIINIVLKKNQKLGFNGSVALTAGTQENYNANGSLSYRDNKWNMYGNYSFRNGNRLGQGFNSTFRFRENNLISNTSDSRRSDISNTGKVGVDFSPNETTTIGLSGNLSIRDNARNEYLNYRYVNAGTLSGTSYRAAEQDEIDNGYDLNLDFTKQFKRKGEEITANISYGNGTEEGIQTLNQRFSTNTISNRINDTYEDGTNWNLQFDYTLPLKNESSLEAGYRSTFRNNAEKRLSDTLNPVLNSFIRDYSLTNDFDLEDIVHGTYLNYRNQITKSFGFQLGVRAEQAYLNTSLTATDTATLTPYTTPGRLDYFRIYPSIFLTQKLQGDNQLQLSYTRRVNRPRGWQVNPFVDVSDPNNYRQGNPNLRPEDIHAMEFSYMKNWSAVTLTSSIYLRQVNDVVQPVITRLTEEATLLQFLNLARNQATGFELISKATLFKDINLTGNFNLNYNRFSGSEEFDISSNSGVNWDANLTSDFKFLKNFTGQIRFDYSAPRVMAQGRSVEVYGLDAAAKMDLMNKQGSISLNVRNILDSRKFGGKNTTADFLQEFERQFQPRVANLTFSYRFGKQEQQRNKMRKEQQQDSPQGDDGGG